MKIACLGNMNNMTFQIGRYLLDEKHDVTFFLFEEFDHFLPQADTYEDVSNYKIVNLNWSRENYFEYSSNEICEKVKGFDFYIGTDIAPAFFFKAGLRLDVFFPHGNDLYDYAFPKYKNTPPQLWEIKLFITGKAQFEGIKKANYFSMDLSEEVNETPLKIIRGQKGKRVDGPPFLYLPQYDSELFNKKRPKNALSDIRNNYKFIVFQHSSQDWSSRGPYKINKGNNVLINAFAAYLKKGENKNDSLLVLVEYGTDVEKSKELIKELGIASNVKWLPKMFRKDIMAAISECDICVGELGPRFWFSYSCICEFIAMKKPVIHHRNDAHYKKLGLELYPMVDASTAEEVCSAFENYRKDPAPFRKMGEEASEWLQKRTKASLDIYEGILKAKQNNELQSNVIPLMSLQKFLFVSKPILICTYFFLLIETMKLNVKHKWLKAS